MEKLVKSVAAHPFVQYGVLGAAVLGGLYGLGEGLSNWSDYMRERRKRHIGNPLVDALMNVAVDGTLLGYHLTAGTALGAGCFVFAPITVPCYLFYSREVRHD